MLHAEADRRERVLDLVRHLPCHFAPRQHALRASNLSHVVECDDDGVGEWRQANPQLLLPAPHRQLERQLLRSAGKEARHGFRQFLRSDIGKLGAGRKRRVKEDVGARVRQQYVSARIDRDHSARDVAQNRGNATLSVFECRPAGVEIGGHATKRGEHRAKLDRWLGIEWWKPLAASERERRRAQAADRACELPRRDTTQPQRGDGADCRGEEYENAQVIPAEPERELLGSGRCGDDEIGHRRTIDGPETEQRRRRSNRDRTANRFFVADHEQSLDIVAQKPAGRRQRREERIAGIAKLASHVEKEGCIESRTLRRQPRRIGANRRYRAQCLANENVARRDSFTRETLVRPDRERECRDNEEGEQGNR